VGYVGYFRVSTKVQGESKLGLEGQLAIVEHFASEQYAACFRDIASGKSTNGREGLKAAIKLCKTGDHTLVVAKADRLSRSVRDALEIFDDLEGRLMCCDVPNTDRFTLTLIFAVAERERELISIRTKAALEAKRQREGRQRINGNPQHLTDEVRAAGRAARTKRALAKNHQARILAHEMRSNGRTLAYIADKLNQSEITTSRGAQFQATSVARLLKSGEMAGKLKN
jgi:DNA invertase Pin-like site-specific DNA recombinase